MVGGCGLGKPRADLEGRAIGETSGGDLRPALFASPALSSAMRGVDPRPTARKQRMVQACAAQGRLRPSSVRTLVQAQGSGAVSASPAGSASCPLGSSVSASPGPCSPSSFVSLSHLFTSHPQWSSCLPLLVPQN